MYESLSLLAGICLLGLERLPLLMLHYAAIVMLALHPLLLLIQPPRRINPWEDAASHRSC